jgi:hypothetical protein
MSLGEHSYIIDIMTIYTNAGRKRKAAVRRDKKEIML